MRILLILVGLLWVMPFSILAHHQSKMDTTTIPILQADPTAWEDQQIVFYEAKMEFMGHSFLHRPGQSAQTVNDGIPSLRFKTRTGDRPDHPGPWFLLSEKFREQLVGQIPTDRAIIGQIEPSANLTFRIRRHPNYDSRREPFGGWTWIGILESITFVDKKGHPIETLTDPDPAFLNLFVTTTP